MGLLLLASPYLTFTSARAEHQVPPLQELVAKSTDIFVAQIGALDTGGRELRIVRRLKESVWAAGHKPPTKLQMKDDFGGIAIYKLKYDCRGTCNYLFFTRVEPVTLDNGYRFEAFQLVDSEWGCIPLDPEMLRSVEGILQIDHVEPRPLIKPQSPAPNSHIKQAIASLLSRVGRAYFKRNYRILKDLSLVKEMWGGAVTSIISFEYLPLTKIAAERLPLQVRVFGGSGVQLLSLFPLRNEQPRVTRDEAVKALKSYGVDSPFVVEGLGPWAEGESLHWVVAIPNRDPECSSGRGYQVDMVTANVQEFVMPRVCR